ncbi:Rid family hydrolase [Flavobacterium fluviale]|uniref:RidA family protein n=1 Tax=Flavobacterium fluviale TaxID=2249356 RepID=A0A344LXP9_9FLAO|nr:Rid family hydrolase [Flavobacterium fluviale]AXB58691.1 RidA family protein [Flavobacterium fluviale]
MLNVKKELGTLSMPWEKEYGYAQAVKNGDTLWISGQLGHDTEGNLAEGMENQFEKTYDNIRTLLNNFGMNEDDIVEEVIYVTDMAAAFQARKKIGKDFYPDPQRVASSIVGVTELALPGQMVEVKIVAKK